MSTAPNIQSQLVEPFQVLKVVDTRDYVEIDDKFVAVPGTGLLNECERCARVHEIHAHVVDANGHAAVVGVGCMNATTPEVRKLQNAAKREARDAAKAVAVEGAQAKLAALKALIPEFPADQVEFGVSTGRRAGSPYWSVGDATVWGHPGAAADDLERLRCLRDSWFRNRLLEMAGGYDELAALQRRAGVYG